VYAALVESVDDAVGAVLKALEDAGVDDHTVVIFTSDNGGLVGSTHNGPLRLGKGHAYEGGIRVPWIVRWPGTVPPGTVSHEPVSTIDIFPTLVEAAGGKLPPGRAIDGVSLVGHLRSGGKEKLKREALFWHFPHYRHAPGPYSIIRAGDWKLTKFYEGPKLELYNLKDDLGEKTDLATKLPAKVQELHKKLTAHLTAVGARLPRPNPNYVGPGKKAGAEPAKAAAAGRGPAKYLPKPDAWFAGPEARRAAANILSYQADLGGWPKNVDTTAAPYRGDRQQLRPTFDNGATTDELRFLARAYNATHDPRYRVAFTRGLRYILQAQYPSGGWPQFAPPPKTYHRHITFNDDAMVPAVSCQKSNRGM
jgi:hypothetical protein